MSNNGVQNIIKFMVYFFYVCIVGFLVLWGAGFQQHLKAELAQSFGLPIIFIMFSLFFMFFIGVLIALPQFLLQAGKFGTWSFDWIRFMAVGLPALLYMLAYFFGWAPGPKFIPYITNPTLYTVSGILLGYSFLASFSKRLNQ